jgi:hypothetical protein
MNECQKKNKIFVNEGFHFRFLARIPVFFVASLWRDVLSACVQNRGLF